MSIRFFENELEQLHSKDKDSLSLIDFIPLAIIGKLRNKS